MTIYKNPDVVTATTTSTTSSPLDPLTSCHCVYNMNSATEYYSLALQTCSDMNGFLPEVDTFSRLADFNSFGYTRVWTGARRQGLNSFIWPSGQTFDGLNVMWASGQPSEYDENCVDIRGDKGRLYDVHCEPHVGEPPNVLCVKLAQSCQQCQPGSSFSFNYGQ